MNSENQGRTKRVAIYSFLLSLLGLAAQFGVRLTMTSSLGLGSAYDQFLIAMIPASLLAQVGFQALASALIPRVSELFLAGRYSFARKLSQHLIHWALALTLGAVVAMSLILSLFVTSFQAPLFLCVMSCWGLLGGWTVIQRQILTYFGKPVECGFSALLPAFALIIVQSFVSVESLSAMIAICSAGHLLSLVLNNYWLQQQWTKISTPDSLSESCIKDSEELGRSIKRMLLAALPIFLASFNSQAMAAIDQGFAAWYQVGGIGLLSLALAISRVPLSLGQSLMFSLCYRDLVDSCQRSLKGQASELSRSLSKALQVQAFLIFPAIALLLVCHDDIAVTLFCRGKLSQREALDIGQLLVYFAPVLFVTMIQAVQIPFLVALEQAQRALKFEIWLTLASAVLNLILVPFFGLGGLVLSTALSTGLIATLLGRQISDLDASLNWFVVASDALRIAVSALCCGLFGFLARHMLLQNSKVNNDWSEIALRLCLVFTVMAVSYLIANFALGSFKQFFQKLPETVAQPKTVKQQELLACA